MTVGMTLSEALERFPEEGTLYSYHDRESKTRPGSDRWICVVARRIGERIEVMDVGTAVSKAGAVQECARMIRDRDWEKSAPPKTTG